MAGIPVLDREIARLSEEQREYRKQENEAAQQHGRSISENYRKLIEPQPQNEPWAEPYAYNTQAYNPAQADPALRTYDLSAPAYAPEAPAGNYAPQYPSQNYAPEAGTQPAPQQNYYQPVYRSDYREPEYHAPVVPSSTPGAPSAAQRLNDYVPIRAGMQSLTRMGDMPSYQPQGSAAYVPAAPAGEKKQLFEGLTYQNGELIDNTGTVAPTYDSSYVPAAPAYAPAQAGVYAGTAYEDEEDEEDALPTRMTLDAATRAPQRMETVERSENAVVAFFRALSTKAKVALACVAVVVVAMISLICVNTALLNSAEAAVLSRQEQVQVLAQRAEELQAEIDHYNSEEYINQWAQEHGMTRGE